MYQSNAILAFLTTSCSNSDGVPANGVPEAELVGRWVLKSGPDGAELNLKDGYELQATDWPSTALCNPEGPEGADQFSGRLDGQSRVMRRQRRDGSFFSLLQKNVLNRRAWATRAQLRIAIVTWIERTYHRRRRQARLGRLTPIEFETIMNNDLALAA